MNDLMGIGTLGLMKAVEMFDIEKGVKFATYAARCIENEILMFLRKNTKYKGNASLNEKLYEDEDGNEMQLSDIILSGDDIEKDFIQNETRKVVKNSLKILNDLERQVVELYYGFSGERLTYYQIGQKLGFSHSYISRVDAKARLKLEKYLVLQGQGTKRKVSPEFDYINELSTTERAKVYAKLMIETKITKENLAKKLGISTATLIKRMARTLPNSNSELYENVTRILEQQANEKEQQRLKDRELKKQLKVQEKEKKQKLREQYQNGYDRRTRVDMNENPKTVKSKVTEEKTIHRFNGNAEIGIFGLFPNYSEQQILNAIDSLNETNKRIIELKYGLNHNPITRTKDIAKQLDIKCSTMSVRVVDIRKMLGKKLEKQQLILSQEKPKSVVTTQNEESIEVSTLDDEKPVSLGFERHKEQIKMLINMLNDPTEQVALLLRLGYVKEQYFTEQQIGQFLSIDEGEIGEIINKGLSNIVEISTITLQEVKLARKQLDLTRKSTKNKDNRYTSN